MTENKQPMKLISVRVDPNVHQKAHIRLIEMDTTFQGYLSEKIAELIEVKIQ